MRIYCRNILAKIYADPVWNDRALGFFEEGRPNKNNNNKMSSDMRPVPDPEIITISVTSVCNSVYMYLGWSNQIKSNQIKSNKIY